jgi:hypothetical protein
LQVIVDIKPAELPALEWLSNPWYFYINKGFYNKSASNSCFTFMITPSAMRQKRAIFLYCRIKKPLAA